MLQMKLKVGIFFGGTSKEREISFAGGRTVYDNLNKSLFEAISYPLKEILFFKKLYVDLIINFFPHKNKRTQNSPLGGLGAYFPTTTFAKRISLSFK